MVTIQKWIVFDVFMILSQFSAFGTHFYDKSDYVEKFAFRYAENISNSVGFTQKYPNSGALDSKTF